MIGETKHFRAFLTVARLNNFTRAANELHVSQSALTVQIRQSEDALGVMLFDRNKLRESKPVEQMVTQKFLLQEDADRLVSEAKPATCCADVRDRDGL